MKNSLTKPRFIPLVEAARGAAALQVLFYHTIEVFTRDGGQSGLMQYLLYPASFGTEAVIFFFLLSGFSIHYRYDDSDSEC